MSDFDKEAERQKLREKFDRDKEKRKETERMSQLLLQGATMTNRHCETCGDPLFRYQGQTFCATCEGRAQEAGADAQATTQQDAGADAQAAAQQDAAVDAGETASDTEGTDAATETGALDSNAAGHPTPPAQSESTRDGRDAASTGSPTKSSATPAVDTNTSASTPEQTRTVGRAEKTTDDGDGIAAARASLVRTLTHHAQQAEAADGPRRATEHLTAVREAAEALAALDRSR